VTSTPSPCHAGRPDSLEFMKQPSSWSVSPNKTMDPVTQYTNYLNSYLNSSIMAKTKHVQDVQVCSQNDLWGKSTPCHASNEKFSPPLPVCFNKEAVPKPLVINWLPPTILVLRQRTEKLFLQYLSYAG